MKKYKKDTTVYPVYSLDVTRMDELIELEYPSKYFVLHIAAGFNKVESNIPEIAKKLIDKGMLYVCTWGLNCGKAHFDFDLGNAIWSEETGNEDHLVMSTWHEDESLENALWFCLFCAMVNDKFWNDCSKS